MTKEEVIKKYGLVEGEKRWKNIERARKWYQENKVRAAENNKRYRSLHPEQRKEEYARAKKRNPNLGKDKYAKNKEKNKERSRQYYLEHREKCLQQSKVWGQNNVEKRIGIRKKWVDNHPEYSYYKTPRGRANALCKAYSKQDRERNRGECTLTAQWVMDNIFSRSCIYCTESDWHRLGCDRINNSKPHTPENVVCCCGKCNSKRKNKDIITFALSIGAVESEYLTIKK